MLRWLYVLWVLSAASVAVAAEDLEFHAPASAEGTATEAAMRSLAVRALPVYQHPNRAQFLTNLSALQMVAGEYVAANATRQSLEEVRAGSKAPPRIDMALLYDMYVRARAAAAKTHVPFDQAFARIFHETVTPLSDRDAYTLAEWLTTPLSVFRENLQGALDRLRSRSRVSLQQAVDLAWTYLSFEAFQSFAPLVGPLIAEDDNRRYIIDADIVVSTPDHASISVVAIRPRASSAPLPALLEFTMSAGPRDLAKESAAHGYAGLVAYARGTGKSAGKSPDASMPYEHDGDDARAVIGWITQQRWSDGRVGMYGTGYAAFAAWSTAKRAPAALKALAVASAQVPGLDAASTEPQEGSAATAAGRWLRHPSFDRYWQQLVPYQKDFAHIDMPVLTITGYYDEHQAASLYYFTQHYRYDTHANHTLLIGPYDAQAMRRGPLPVLEGYAIDTAALIDLHELRYRWFDHVLKGGPTPEPLTDRVNFEVMGANVWRHAESLRAMANRATRLYLDTKRNDGEYRLSGHEPPKKRFVEQKIQVSAPTSPAAPPSIVSSTLASHDAVAFYSGPLHRPLQLSGLVSGQLDFHSSRSNLDLSIALYELTPSGDFFQLFAPPYGLCAGGALEQHRHTVALKVDRLTSVELKTGSRLIMVIDADPSPPARSGNCSSPGVGRPTSAHLAAPGDVRWYAGSFIEIPVSR